MINADMRKYGFYTIGKPNAYGQAQMPDFNTTPNGYIKMAVYVTSQSIQANIKYKEAAYIGLTQDTDINDTYVIQYENERLKVLYVQTQGRYKQVFMQNI